MFPSLPCFLSIEELLKQDLALLAEQIHKSCLDMNSWLTRKAALQGWQDRTHQGQAATFP